MRAPIGGPAAPAVWRQRPARVALTIFLLAALVGSAGAKSEQPARAELAALFPAQSDVRAQVLAGYDKGGLGVAMKAYASYRSQRAPLPYYRVGMETRSPEQITQSADRVLEGRATFGGRPAFPFRPPIAWGADPYGDRSWRFWLNALDPLDDLLAAYVAGHDRKYLHAAESIACDWISTNPAGTTENPFAWYDMAVGLRAMKLAYLVDAGARDPDTKGDTLWTLLRGSWWHGEYLVQDSNFTATTNHGIYQSAGLLALARTLPELGPAPRWHDVAASRLRGLFQRSFSSEGVHLEHSPGYQLFMTRLLTAMLDSGLTDDPFLTALRTKAESALCWMIAPDGRLARLGDTDATLVLPEDFGLPGHALSSDLAYVLTKGKLGTRPSTAYRVFPEAGLAVFRSGWPVSAQQWQLSSFLIFSAAFHSRTHKHADDLTFEWWDAGRQLVVDSGSYGYYYDQPERKYCESTRAHNTVEIDGADLSRNRLEAFGSALDRWGGSSGAYYISAQVTRTPLGLRHRRTLVVRPKQWLVVLDEIESDRPHHYTQWFHFAPDLSLQQAGARAEASLGAAGQLTVLPLLSTTGVTPTLVRGVASPVLQGWTSYHHRELQPNWALGYSTSGRSVTMATLFRIGGERPQVTPASAKVRPGLVRVEWRWGGKTEGFSLARGQQWRLSLLGMK